MEVFRGKVRAEVGPVAPYGAVLHEAVFQKDLLAGNDVVMP